MFFSLDAKSQSKKDSITYHFSFKNGWAIKVAPFALLDAEARVYVEKRITKNKSVELFGAYFTNKLPSNAFYDNVQSGDAFLETNIGSDNYKIGAAYINLIKQTNNYFEVDVFYKKYHNAFHEHLNLIGVNEQYFYQVGCIQFLYGRRIQYAKNAFFDFYGGIGLRTKFVQTIFTKYTDSPILTPWHHYVDHDGIAFFPSIQLGINFGLKTK